MSNTIFFSLIFAQLFLNGAHAVLLAWADYPRANEFGQMQDLAKMMASESGLSDISFVSFVNTSEPRWLIHLAVMITLTICFYIVIVICVIRIRKAVSLMTSKLRDYNKQISAALLFQAILPTFEIAAWCIQIFLPMFMADQSTVMYIVFSDIAIHLVPVLNPIGTIFRAVLNPIKGVNTTIIRSVTAIRTRYNQASTTVAATPQMANIQEIPKDTQPGVVHE
uniref:G protein-coupled receptor n=1 Tax=Meloidogyne javanica TaxID=6303 RepID=A0A915LZ66_MELJA